MLTPTQSLRVAIWSVHAVSGETATPKQKLRNVGIPDRDHLDLVNDMITLSKENGVRFYDHEIDRHVLDELSVGNSINEVAVLVQDNAIPQGKT